MLRSAKEVRTLTDKVLEEIAQKNRDNAVDEVNKCIAPMIEETAHEGRAYVEYHCSHNDVDLCYVIQLLRSAGYEVNRDGRHLRITW